MLSWSEYALAVFSGGMWKKTFSAIMLLVFCLAISACDSGNTKKVEEAYEVGNFSEVINALVDELDLGAKTAEILSISKAQAAFDAGSELCQDFGHKSPLLR